jgi:hypothetical protein
MCVPAPGQQDKRDQKQGGRDVLMRLEALQRNRKRSHSGAQNRAPGSAFGQS